MCVPLFSEQAANEDGEQSNLLPASSLPQSEESDINPENNIVVVKDVVLPQVSPKGWFDCFLFFFVLFPPARTWPCSSNVVLLIQVNMLLLSG